MLRLVSYPRLLLAIIVFCFLIRGIFYCSFTPLWEGYDEWAHFGVVQQMANTGKLLVDRSDPVTREVWATMHLAPAPWDTAKPFTTHDAFWKLTPEERQTRATALKQIPLAWAKEQVNGASPIYEALQPPLYYWMMLVPYKMAAHSPLANRVLILRLSGLMIAAIALLIVYKIALLVFHSSSMALVTVSLVAVLPELMVNICRVGNECLGIVVFSWLTLLVLQSGDDVPAPKASVWIGVALGAGLLTKAYFLTAIPAVIFVSMGRAWKGKRWAEWCVRLITTLSVAIGIAGWWYGYNKVTTGTWSGLLESAKLVHYTVPQFLRGAMQVDWRNAFDSILFSHIWFGGWSSLQVRSWMYHLLYLVIAVSAAGVVVAFRRENRRGVVFPLVMIYSWYWAGQLYNVLLLFLTKGASTSMGWYMYCVIAAEIMLLIIGLEAPVHSRFRLWIVSGLATLMGSLDLYSVNFVSVPYYAGLTSHRANGGAVSSFHFSLLEAVGFGGLSERLSLMKATFVTAQTEATFHVLYVLTTLIVMALPYWLSRQSLTSSQH